MLSAVIGGALIGLAATLFAVANGRVAGVSGMLSGVLRASDRRGELVAFLGGLVVAGLIFLAFRAPPAPVDQPIGVPLVAGLLVGFGTRLGGGCTSGHGVCGLSRFSTRSLVATLTFMAAGVATVFLLGHLLPELRVR
jgi:uncharacterized membrane protein YedE/YeeE